MITETLGILKITVDRTDAPASISLKTPKTVVSYSYVVTDGHGIAVASGSAAPASADVAFSYVADVLPWTLDAPTLYTLSVTCNYTDGTCEVFSDRYGYRYISSDEKHIYLNGYPFYMRAYIRGAAAHEHENNCGLPEYEFYKKNILMAKQYGFNTIRFHSTIPPEACFRAADDLGIMIHIEMRRGGKKYDNLREMLYGKNDFVENSEIENIVNRLYNHPSFMVYCVGNEIRQPATKPRIREIRDYIKSLDPTRLFIDTCAHGEYDRDYVDFDVQHMSYYYPYGKNADMFENTDNLLGFGTARDIDMESSSDGVSVRRGISFTRPLIAHEVCHYTSWRDFYALRDKFIAYGKPLPWWIDEEIKMLEAKGYKENFADCLQITKDFQFRAWKTAIEAIRASNLLSGFHMLQFADTDRYENSNGVVDCFDDPHGISASAFRAFNSDTVILARPERRIFTENDLVSIPIFISQFAINPATVADFSFKLATDSGVVRSGELKRVDTGKSGLYEICRLKLSMPMTEKPEKLILSCRLDFESGESLTNEWELWLFPRSDAPTARLDMNAKYLDRAVNLDESSQVVITDKLDDSLFDRLDRGENVILIYRTDWTRHLLHKDMAAPKYSFRHTWDRYKGVIWDRGTQNGGPDDKELLNRHGFVTDGQINYQYYSLIDDSDKINLDGFPVRVHSLVSGLDKSSRDRFDPKKFELPELMYDRTMRRFSYAFSLNVGRGRLLVTGFNFSAADYGDPAAIAMLRTLISYASSDDFLGDRISTVGLRAYLSDIAAHGPQKERMMTQYWQLDAEPVESMDYWEESERYLREN